MKKCPDVSVCSAMGSEVHVSLLERVFSFQRVLCTGLGCEDVSLLERCPHFRGCYVQASMELGSEDTSQVVFYQCQGE